MLLCRLSLWVISGYTALGVFMQGHAIHSKWQFLACSILGLELFGCYIFAVFQWQANLQAATATRSQIYYWWKTYESRTFYFFFFFWMSSHLIRITPENFAQLTVWHPDQANWKFNYVCMMHLADIIVCCFMLRFMKHGESSVPLRFSAGELGASCLLSASFLQGVSRAASRSLRVSLFLLKNVGVLFKVRVVGVSAAYSYLSPQDSRPLSHPAVDR